MKLTVAFDQHRTGACHLKITDLKIRALEGVMTHDDPFWEERLVRPIDIYPEYTGTAYRGNPG